MLKRNISLWNKKSARAEVHLQNELQSFGIKLDIETGHLFYTPFFKPLVLNFELVFVRHGETYGNCGQSSSTGKIDEELVNGNIKDKEKRIYQGNVDTEINQLTEFGKKQAFEAAEKLHDDFLKKGWTPDIILMSPLTRAKDTALPFIKQNQFEDRCIVCDQIKEMSFGSWDNRRVCDISSDDPCHLFYREQHVLVKNSGINCDGIHEEAENFCEVLFRAYNFLIDLNKNYSGKKIIMFSHSMFGAACCILLGLGQKIEDGEYLAFDGKRKDGSYYTMPNATPFLLNLNESDLSIKNTLNINY